MDMQAKIEDALHELGRAIIAGNIAAERERCAKIIEGETFKEVYRTWQWWGSGNRANDSEMVKFCDAAASAIREAK